MREDNYDEIYWKRIEKFNFFYPLTEIWNLNPLIRKVVFILWIISILGIGFIVYTIVYNKLVNQNSLIVFIFWVAVVSVLLSIVAIIYILFDKCRFKAWIYSKWVEIDLNKGFSYSELNEVKIFHYTKNWNEYIKLIHTEYDDRIITEDILYNHKMDSFLGKLQETLKRKGINCEKITDINDMNISEPIEYKAYFWFRKVWKLLTWKEKWKRLKGFSVIYLLTLIVLLFWLFYKRFTIEEIKSSIQVFFIMAWILLAFIIIYFIFSIKKFYARKENNAVYIRNYKWLTDNYVLSKIKVNYWFIAKWNVEWIVLTISNWKENTVYKRPKNEEVEHFCNNLLAEIRKHKTA